jgi:predicted nucleic acid-binding protein
VTDGRAVYLDASAIVKLLVAEPGSADLAEYIAGRRMCITSRISEVEVRRAVARSEASVDAGHVDSVFAALTIREVDESLAAAAGRLAPPALRTLDAIHLATALELAPELEAFVTYDQRLADSAAAAGIPTASPGAPSRALPVRDGDQPISV